MNLDNTRMENYESDKKIKDVVWSLGITSWLEKPHTFEMKCSIRYTSSRTTRQNPINLDRLEYHQLARKDTNMAL
jgi:hypothetical protein